MSRKIIVSFGSVDRILIRMERCQALLCQLGGSEGCVSEDAVAAAADLLDCICTDFRAIIEEIDEKGDGSYDK